MRIGGNIFDLWTSPEEWAQAAVKAGYSAVYFPVDYRADMALIDGCVVAAREHDLVISEVGVWRNALSPNRIERDEAFSHSVHQLELAEYVGARCCVNISGTFSEQWDGPHKDNLTPQGFEAVVDVTQRILDAVNPRRTCFTLEPMPWAYPTSADEYLRLFDAVDRKGFGAHVDLVNVINSPWRYYNTTSVINDWFDKLGDRICSVHAKDITLSGRLTVHLDECRPGTGGMDYETLLTRVSLLSDPNTPVMLEHMTAEEDYRAAAAYIRATAQRLNLTVM